MGLKEFLNDSAAVRLGLWLGKALPLEKGRRIALKLGAMIAKRKNNHWRAGIMANQKQITAGKLNAQELEQRCLEACQNLVVSQFDYFYYFQHRDQLLKAFTIDEEGQRMIDEISQSDEPLLFLGPHLGNFDLLGILLISVGMEALVLSAPAPSDAYIAQNQLRAIGGLTVMPMSLAAFREARKTLFAKGRVITGVDRPSDDQKLRRKPPFFGKPSLLPTFYEKLAIDSGARIRIGAAVRKEDDNYQLLISKPIYFTKEDEPDDGNIKKVTDVIEAWIEAYPGQWAIFKPLWPSPEKGKPRSKHER